MNDLKEWRGNELEETKDLMKDEIKEILSVEFMHALGGTELLGTVWNQYHPSTGLAEADSKEIAIFLQSQMTQREQIIFCSAYKGK